MHVDQFAGLFQAREDIGVLPDMGRGFGELLEIVYRLVFGLLINRPEFIEIQRLGALMQDGKFRIPIVMA